MAVTPSLLVTVIAAVPLISLLLLSYFIKKKPAGSDDAGRRRQLPPSPAGLPLVGHLHLLGSLPHRSLRSLAATHGPVMLLRLGRVPTVVVSSAEAAEEAMKTRDLSFAGRPRSLMAERLFYGCRDVGFAPYGEYWRQARRVCAVHLLGPRRVHSFRHARELEVAALVGRVREREGSVVNLSDALICYSKNVISRAAFGDEYGLDDKDDGGEKLRRVFAEFEELIAAAPVQETIAPWLWWVDSLTGLEARTARTFRALDGFLNRVIGEHRSRRRRSGSAVAHKPDGDHEDHRDLVDVLLDVNEMDKETGFRLDTDNIKGIIMDIFAAGTDTAYTVLSWAMAELINHPNEMRKLQHEIRATSTTTGTVTEDHLDGMVYLKAVISETMRLHVPAPFLIPRETVEDTELQGYRIPAGTRVMVNAWAIGRDPAAWGSKTAEEFVPGRWFAGDDAAVTVDYSKTVGQDFRFLPFGAGRRGCPGAGFAAPTVELALANMLYHFDWEPAATTRQQQQSLLDMSEEYGLSLRLKAPLLLVAKPWSADQ